MFPQAAAANPQHLLRRAGRARSVGEVYGKLTGRFETARAVASRRGTRVADLRDSCWRSHRRRRAASRQCRSRSPSIAPSAMRRRRAPPVKRRRPQPSVARHRRRHAGLRAGRGEAAAAAGQPSRCSSRCSPIARQRAVAQTVSSLWAADQERAAESGSAGGAGARSVHRQRSRTPASFSAARPDLQRSRAAHRR